MNLDIIIHPECNEYYVKKLYNEENIKTNKFKKY